MPRGLKLKRYSIKNANHWHLRVFRLRIEVTETSPDMPKDIFVYRRHPADPHSGVIFDEFCTVASPVDLSEYPVGGPDPVKDFPFFRKDFIEVDVRSMTEFQDVWDLVVKLSCQLATTLDDAENLVMDEEMICGELPISSESVSEPGPPPVVLPLTLFALTLGQLSQFTAEQLYHLQLF